MKTWSEQDIRKYMIFDRTRSPEGILPNIWTQQKTNPVLQKADECQMVVASIAQEVEEELPVKLVAASLLGQDDEEREMGGVWTFCFYVEDEDELDIEKVRRTVEMLRDDNQPMPDFGLGSSTLAIIMPVWL